jgi:hypothetical protein
MIQIIQMDLYLEVLYYSIKEKIQNLIKNLLWSNKL